MDRLFGKRFKKSPKPPQHVFSGTPTNIAAGPLGFRAELDIEPEDEKDLKASRIVFCEKERGDQGAPVQGASTSGAVIGGHEQGNGLPKAGPGDTSGPPVASTVPGRDREDTTLQSIVIPICVAKETTDGFGSLNAALKIVCIDCEESTAIGKKVKNLHSHIAALEILFATRPDNVTEQGLRSELIRKLGSIEGQLRSPHGTPGLQRLDGPVHDNRDVFGLLEDLQEAIFHYQVTRQTMIHEQALGLIDPDGATILNNLRCAQAAEYRHGDRNGCMKGTRGAVLDEIELWTKDLDRSPVYWLNGLAGTGKSTIAQTIAKRTFASGRLGASFFCSRDFLDRSDLQFIFPTLAVQLARNFTEFRSTLIPLVRSDPGIINESLYRQMEKVIVRPFKESGISTVIIIDALDECRDDQPASAILSVLGQLVSEIPKVKFFLTGRPERWIREGFRLPRMAEATDVFILHEIEPRQIGGDIRLFFKKSFSELASRQDGPEDWPTEEQLDLLCERAAGLFTYAVATVKFIDHKNNDPEEQLDRLIKSSESSAREGKTKLRGGMSLDSLYMTILREAFDGDDPEDDHRIRSVLGAIALAANPLSPSTIATLLGLRTKSVSLRLSSVHSLLILQEDVNHPVRPFHKSFPDFIIDPARCTDQRFRISPPDHHSELLIGCLELMNQRLERNMCKLPDGVANSEVCDLRERVEQHIDHSLQYACESWHKHLVDPCKVPTHAPKITSVIHRFLDEKVLFWLEVLSVLGTARNAVDALEAAAKWLDGSPTLELVNDCFRFVTRFFEVISTSAPHIYHSALPLSPRTSIMRRLYERYAHPLARVVCGVPTSWDPSIATIKCSSSIRCVAWSPCNRFIAISLEYEMELHLLDAMTLKRLKSFTPSHRSAVLLTFTPESRSLMWFSDQPGVITSWDLQTGVRVGEILTKERRLARALSITHSGCGTMLGVLFRNVYGATNINTYNILSGTLIFRHPIEETNTGTIWTHGDCVRFATVGSWSITVWELGFSSELSPTEVESFPTPDDFHTSNEFLFHPTPPRLASIVALEDDLEETVIVWDIQYSNLLLNSIDLKMPEKMLFSTDGHFFVCQGGQEIYLWKESPTGYILHHKLVPNSTSMEASSSRGLPMNIQLPFFSPNGQLAVMARGRNLQLWRTTDSSSSTSSVPTQDSLGSERFVMGFSLDGLLAAVARSRGDTAIVLDLKSGAIRLTVETGARIYALGLARNIIAVVGDGEVLTWNLPTGIHVSGIRADRNDSVWKTRLSPWTPSEQIWILNTIPTDPTFAKSDSMSPRSVSISPDLNYVAVTRGRLFGRSDYHIYDVSIGTHVKQMWSEDRDPSCFTRDGREFWIFRGWSDHIIQGRVGGPEGWAIVRDSKSKVTKLEGLHQTGGPSEGPPWESSRGCQVTTDGWVLNSTGKRLLWLLPHWRSEEEYCEHRVWSGRFLALLYPWLSEVVILELLVE